MIFRLKKGDLGGGFERNLVSTGKSWVISEGSEKQPQMAQRKLKNFQVMKRKGKQLRAKNSLAGDA